MKIINNLSRFIIFLIIFSLFYNNKLFDRLYLFFNSAYTEIFSIIQRTKTPIKICKPLQEKLIFLLGENNSSIGLTILDSNHNIISDINGNKLFMPASNQKIFSTSYALHKKGPNHRLSTSLYKNSKGYYEITGSGDPDISDKDIKLFATTIKNNPFYSYPNNLLVLYEESNTNWWPESWLSTDRKEDYGAPITRLALNANVDNYAIKDPLKRFELKTIYILKEKNINSFVETRNHKLFNKTSARKLLLSKKSAPLFMLINLANSESHNFSSEVLLRNTSNSWSNIAATNKLRKWVISIGVDENDIIFADGSGLSRNNKTTTKAISQVLAFMDNHRYSNYFVSSMSFLGMRGTLRNQYSNENNSLIFLGKSGTLSDVRSLSGYLYSPNGLRIVSIIQNKDIIDNTIFSKLLSTINSEKNCI